MCLKTLSKRTLLDITFITKSTHSVSKYLLSFIIRWEVVAEITNVGGHPLGHLSDENGKDGDPDQGQEIGTGGTETAVDPEVVPHVNIDLQIETGGNLNEKGQIKLAHPLQIILLEAMENRHLAAIVF